MRMLPAFFAVIFFSSGAVEAKDSPYRKLDGPALFAPLREGKDLYFRSCLSCHGATMMSLRQAATVRGDDALYKSVKRHARIQPALSDEEAWKVILWMRTYHDRAFHQAQAQRANHPGEASNPGRYFYRLHCGHCHGYTQNEPGPAAQFFNPKPPHLNKEHVRLFSEPELILKISQGVRGGVMPAWREVLTDKEITQIARFLLAQ